MPIRIIFCQNLQFLTFVLFVAEISNKHFCKLHKLAVWRGIQDKHCRGIQDTLNINEKFFPGFHDFSQFSCPGFHEKQQKAGLCTVMKWITLHFDKQLTACPAVVKRLLSLQFQFFSILHLQFSTHNPGRCRVEHCIMIVEFHNQLFLTDSIGRQNNHFLGKQNS